MRGSRVFGAVLLFIGLLAVPVFKDVIDSLLFTGIWVGLLLVLLVFLVGGSVLAAIRGSG